MSFSENLVTQSEQTMKDTVGVAVNMVETVMKKAWTVVEAAAEKQAASEYLSQKGIQAMQGKAPKG